MQGAMKMPILENDGVMKEEEGNANIGIFTVDPEHPVYQDPFYENDSTVLASFPFDHRRIDKYLSRCWILEIILFAVLALLFSWSSDYFFDMAILMTVLFFLNCWSLWTILSTQRQRHCSHIAIATTGIYLDEVTSPGLRTLKNRLVFKYEDFEQCYVQQCIAGGEYDPISEYEVMLKKKGSIEAPFSLVKGLLGTQTFADRVNSMIARVEGKSTGGDTVQADVILMDPDYAVNRDSFYENDSTVIASFPFDHNIFNKAMMYSCIMMPLLVALFYVILFFLFCEDVGALILVAFIPMVFFIVIRKLRSITRQVQYTRRCTHIALAQTGIYVDCVSAPGSRIHMCRTVYLYEDYDSCFIEERRFWSCFGYVEYRVMLLKKNQWDRPVFLLSGLLAPHLFAEKVQAMIERVAEERRNFC